MLKSTIALAVLLLSTAAAPAPALDVTPLQQLFMLKEMKGDLQRVGLILSSDAAGDAELMKQIQKAGAAAGLKIVLAEVDEVRDVAPKFRNLSRDHRVQALWILETDRVFGSDITRSFLIKNALESGLVLMAPALRWVNEGACVALSKDGDDIKISVNQAAAQALSVKVPEKYLERTQFLAAN